MVGRAQPCTEVGPHAGVWCVERKRALDNCSREASPVLVPSSVLLLMPRCLVQVTMFTNLWNKQLSKYEHQAPFKLPSAKSIEADMNKHSY